MGSNMNQRGMAKALGLTQQGNVLERFISSQAIAGYVVAELAAKLKNPLVFQWDSGAAEVPPATPPPRPGHAPGRHQVKEPCVRFDSGSQKRGATPYAAGVRPFT